MKNSVSRFLKWTVYTLLTAAVIHTALLIASGLALRRSYAALRAAGRPMTLKEIIPPDIPADDNGAGLYRAAEELLKSEKDGDGKLIGLVGKSYLESPDVEINRLAMERLLANPTIAEALSLIESATRKPVCRFEVAYDCGSEILVPHASFLLGASRFFAGKILWEAKNGRGEAAWQTALIGLRMADALRHEPMLISQLVRIAQISATCKAIQQAADATPLDGERARELDTSLAGLDDIRPFASSMDGERLVCGEWFFNKSSWEMCRLLGTDVIGDLDDNVRKFFQWAPLYKPLRQFDHAHYLQIMFLAAQAAEAPFGKEISKKADQMMETMPKWCVGSRSLAPSLPRRRTEDRAWLRVTRTGLALKRHRALHGEYPTDLASLDSTTLSAALIDPFTDRSLLYRREGDGFALYSAGPNQKDDGGKPESSSNKWACDIVWRSIPAASDCRSFAKDVPLGNE